MIAADPIACAFDVLAPHELRRQSALLELLKAATVVHAETVDGLRLQLEGPAPTLAQLGDLIALERRCCPFLAFDLHCPAGAGPLALRISGPPAAIDLIRATFVEPA